MQDQVRKGLSKRVSKHFLLQFFVRNFEQFFLKSIDFKKFRTVGIFNISLTV